MLVLTRKEGEILDIGDNVSLVVVAIRGGKVRLGVQAPREVAIVRREVAEEESHGRSTGTGAAVPPGDARAVRDAS